MILTAVTALLFSAVLTTASTLIEIATAKDAPFTSLVAAVQSANLVEALSGSGPFTVFAPTDDAFKKLKAVPSGDALKQVLLTHVVKGKILSTDLKNGTEVETLSGAKVMIIIADGKVKVDNAMVTKADVMADNGVIHIIDTVIVPNMNSSKPAGNSTKPVKLATAVDVAASNPNFSTLVSLVKSANLVAPLAAEGKRYTVFAPTNDAFKGLKAVPTGDALKQVLLYHVVSGMECLWGEGQVLTTLQGGKLMIEENNGTFTVNNITILDTVKAKTAVVYVIGKVLIPPSNATAPSNSTKSS